MPFRGRPHQGRLAFVRFHCVHVGAMRDQQLRCIGAACARGDHQGSFTVPAGGLGVRAGVEQFGDQGSITVGAGQCERRFAVFVRCVHFGAGGEQGFDGLTLSEVDGPG